MLEEASGGHGVASSSISGDARRGRDPFPRRGEGNEFDWRRSNAQEGEGGSKKLPAATASPALRPAAMRAGAGSSRGVEKATGRGEPQRFGCFGGVRGSFFYS
jgi:hypothetical protein